MSDLLSQASAVLGVPEPLLQRAAAARAAASGLTTDQVLAAWAGGEAPPPQVAQPPSDAAESPPAAETPPAAGAVAAPAPPIPAAAAPAVPPAAFVPAPVPSEVTIAAAAHLPEVVTVPTAGIMERTSFRIPRWLVATFLVVPAFGLTLLGGSETGACGERTELAADVVTGEIVNCDGSTFTGSGPGGGGANYLANGEAIFNGQGATCSGCHGPSGGGTPAGPSLTGVLTTFSACVDHLEWVRLGSNGFTAEGRTTYGDTDKPVGGFGGVMPGHASLSEEQLASVSAFERVRFGGGDPDTVLSDCGLTEAVDEDGSTTVPGETS